MPLIGPASPKSDPRIAQYLPLCRRLAFRYARSCAGHFDIDDLVSIGMRVVWQACGSWSPERGANFTTYVIRCVNTELMNAVKYTRRDRRIPTRETISTSPITPDDGFFDIRSEERSPEDIACERSAKGIVAHLMRGLDARHRLVVRRRSHGATLEEIGAELGVTRERVRQLEVQAMAKMRRVAGRRGE